MPTIFLRWDDRNMVEQGYNIYRSRQVIDTDNPPTPIATVPRGHKRYTDDDSGLITGVTYYYAVSAFIGDTELFSDVIEFIPSDNTIFATTSTNKVIRYSDGAIVWEYTHDTALSSLYFAKDNRLYVSSGNTILILNPSTGDIVDQIRMLSNVTSISSSPDEKSLVIRESTSKITVIDSRSFYVVANNVGNGTRASLSNDAIYVGVSSSSITKYDYSGSNQWSYTNINGTITSIVYQNGKVYFTHGNDVGILDDNGALLESRSIGAAISGMSVDRYGNITLRHGTSISYLDVGLTTLWTYTASRTVGGVTNDINGTPILVENNTITIMNSEGEVRTTISGESNNRIAVSLRPMLPTVYDIDDFSGIVELNGEVTGIMDYDTANSGGVVIGVRGVTMNTEMTYEYEGDFVQYETGLEIKGIQFNTLMTYDVEE